MFFNKRKKSRISCYEKNKLTYIKGKFDVKNAIINLNEDDCN